MNTSNIQFGILASININNKHYLQKIDRIKYLHKIDTFNYLKPFERMGYSSVEDMIEDGVKGFEDDAKWIKSFDGPGFGTDFYVVCFITDKDGRITNMEKIKKLYY